jgi:hypothetical protein
MLLRFYLLPGRYLLFEKSMVHFTDINDNSNISVPPAGLAAAQFFWNL